MGRLAIYSPVMTSSMNVLSDIRYDHGLAVIPRKQTNGKGRNDNQVRIDDLVFQFSDLIVYFYLVA